MRPIKQRTAWRHSGAFKAALFIFFGTIVSAWLVFVLENGHNGQFRSFWDGVWWTLVTISTVGYGDLVPSTVGGKTLAVVMMLFGVALLSVITATISSQFVTQKLKEGKGLQEVKLKDHLIFCGWNRQSEEILDILQKRPRDYSGVVLINQLPEETILEILDRFTSLNVKFVRGDFTKEVVLNRAGVQRARVAIVVPDESAPMLQKSDERTLLATLSIKTLNPKIRVIVRILDRENYPHLSKAKADEIIVSDAFTGHLIANHVVAPGIPQLLEQLFTEDSDVQLNQHPIPDELIGRTYVDLQNYCRQKDTRSVLLGLGEVREQFDLSALLGSDYSYLDEFIMRKFQEAGKGKREEKRIKIHLAPSADTKLTKSHFYLILERKKS